MLSLLSIVFFLSLVLKKNLGNSFKEALNHRLFVLSYFENILKNIILRGIIRNSNFYKKSKFNSSEFAHHVIERSTF